MSVVKRETEVAFAFDKVEAQLWVKEDIVVTVICGFFPEEESPACRMR